MAEKRGRNVSSITSNIGGAWRAADQRRKVMLIVSIVAVAAVLWLFGRIIATPTMALLYSGLDSSAASGVVEGLERQGVPYEVRGDAIFVPSNQRDKVRITLAGQGLPAAGAAGYELLDTMSGFGTTAEMFDAAYWRAKEGELARTILASQRVIRARVHIAQKKRQPFERETPVTASVTVSTSSGALSRNQAEAIRFLVASAVAGLSLTNVAVIDQENGVILRSGEQESESSATDDAAGKAEAMRRSVTRLLEARVGAGAAIVEVAVDTRRDSETVRERVLDPESKIVVHTDKEESTDDAEGDANAVTVASNLADGDVEGAGDQTRRQASRTRERVNYEVSETVRERVRPAGEIQRVTVAVMVDGIRTPQPDGTALWTARPEAEIEALRELVESAVGFDEARGDQVTIQSLEFSDLGGEGVVAQAGFMDAIAANAMSLVQLLTLGIVALLLGLFVIKPILSSAGAAAGGGEMASMGQMDEGFSGDDGFAIDGDVGLAGDMGGGMGADADFFSDAGGGEAISMPSGAMIDAGAMDYDQRDLLESTVAEKPEEAARQLGVWLDDELEPAALEGAA
ncbi:MAG: flagellar basal-body MS-ring/collar protein FliF [Pseudomonadota bacterium]